MARLGAIWANNLWDTGIWDADIWAPATAPAMTTATISADGNSITLRFAVAMQFGSGGNAGWVVTMSGGASAMTYASGAGSKALVYSLARTIDISAETGTIAYTQPGDGVEDLNATDLATFSGVAVLLGVDARHQNPNRRFNDVTLRHKDQTLWHEDPTLDHNE